MGTKGSNGHFMKATFVVSASTPEPPCLTSSQCDLSSAGWSPGGVWGEKK